MYHSTEVEKPKTQQEKILRYLKLQGAGISSLTAFRLMKITRLSDVIFRLRNKGYNIISERPPNKRYVIYKLIKKP